MKNIIAGNILMPENWSFTYQTDSILRYETIGYHSHSEMELACVFQGNGIRTINGLSEPFNDGDVVFTPSGFPHCWEFAPPTSGEDGVIEESCFQLRKEFLYDLKKAFKELAPMADFYCSLKQAIFIYGDAARFVHERMRSFTAETIGRQCVALLEILISIYESGQYNFIGMPEVDLNAETQSKFRYQIVNRYITENYQRAISLGGVASLVQMSPTAFCNAFKKSSGLSFGKYLLAYRMKMAAKLLSTTLDNISEIAYKVGYNDAPHFTKTFHRYFGVSPSEYRNLRSKH
ncbi:MAG: AraC family transcriptional regulator [Bacteroidales bacterium]|nr:AraC family transcriptional regulator [Bacteroidales bacterium]